ncbi:MAG TPA: BON domain-containing protein [Bryobacteraceae bacterium]|jgi:hyperosmotically inducible protein|nr:BON domain-containing protein [Bryobacteraceae bacterium]
MSKIMWGFLLGVLAIGAQAQGPGNRHASQKGVDRITKEVRHELVMLPYYSVFDDLAYKVDGDTVTLFGAVTRPTLKSDAENAVKKIEGVERVINNIEVLPVSSNDNQIRRAVYRAIYAQPGLDMYSLRAVPTIHIIVKNGNVTLTGAVANEGDKERANIAANGVPGVFSVKNDIQVGP